MQRYMDNELKRFMSDLSHNLLMEGGNDVLSNDAFLLTIIYIYIYIYIFFFFFFDG